MKKFKFEISAYFTLESEGDSAEEARYKLIGKDFSMFVGTQDWTISDGKEIK